MKVVQFVDEGLGNAAHLLISERERVAALIDPLRDVDRYTAAAAREGVTITHILETHVHNDFISGSRELLARSGATLFASQSAGLQFDHQPVKDGDAVPVGDITVQVLATPGHTPEHVSFLAAGSGAPGTPPVLFSGGSLLVGAVSRTDLLGREHAAGLARALYRSLHEKVLPLPDEVAVYPTHGAGSFCTAVANSARSTTIGSERRSNPYLQLATAEAFVAQVLQAMPSYPAYFRQMRAINQQGPRVLGGVPQPAPLSPGEVQRRMASGEAVIDLRPVQQYAASHIPGAFHAEHREGFASWVGWVVAFGTPLVLLAEPADILPDAVRQLIRIGYDDLPGYLDGGMAAWKRAGLPVTQFPVLTVRDVRRRLAAGEPLLVLDVRQDAEWEAGHIPGARHMEAGDVPSQGSGLPQGHPIAVHCEHGVRAATALSVLERLGVPNLQLLPDGYQAWAEAGLPTERPA